MSEQKAVVVEDVSKMFRLYKERNNSVKAALMRGRRAIHEDFWALKGVSFDVPKGETFGLIGETGSGKSTMLKVLTKILARSPLSSSWGPASTPSCQDGRTCI
jgi:lipopolysaccharide transport system ATP-binding protein